MNSLKKQKKKNNILEISSKGKDFDRKRSSNENLIKAIVKKKINKGHCIKEVKSPGE